ncbi:MAG: ABC transporter permease [Defluviitaleaceae bacterium]|nr:ABC transporter permease [Defluviitaleaceae bacterium]
MNAVKAIFVKQLNDFPKNMSIALMFIMYPVIAWVVSSFMGQEDPEAGNMIVMQFAMIFVGMTPLIMMANGIAEDNEYKSLRFLVTAGVKPVQYLVGLMSFTIIMSVLPLLAFAWIGGISGGQFAQFMGLGMLGVLASSVLGAVIGLFSKNVQQCAAIYSPIMMVLSFVPFLSMFNDTVARVGTVIFTGQIFYSLIEIVIGSEAFEGRYNEYGEWVEGILPMYSGMNFALLVVAANALLFIALFVVAYRKRGLRG